MAQNRSILIHEHNDKGQHRLVRYAPDGQDFIGEWVDVHTLATLGKFFAHAGSVDQSLPLGPFTLHEVPHQVLS